ncbi:NEL-type E3 ubiquitin ligase domain-containing protein [Pseudomonas putida]|uniref:NEL-type E3 ubiquitin ligase domain-containing protein n=1 Tax=Pseudomonas putida TaxID=303 RepID=UPI0023654365|nr:NEL-type E3 ubiquitin ligase domain-containing protein [Pseudomonas putida]MDD2048597.1 hypothetical protein [Pseudomonas putida]
MTAKLIPADSVDALIARCLPGWLSSATSDQLHALHRALGKQQASEQQVQELLSTIPALDDFAAPLLRAALHRSHRLTTNVRTSRVRVVEKVFPPPVIASAPVTPYTRTSSQRLLAAALHNFTDEETRPRAFTQVTLLDASRKPLSIAFEDFARLCRQLDLGGKYQAVLRERLLPADVPDSTPGQARQRIEAMLEEVQRSQLEVAVRLAALKGEIDSRSYLLMLPVIAGKPVVPATAAVLKCRQLFLLGARINGVVVVEIYPPGDSASVQGIIAWVPDDPQQPLQAYTSWAALYQALGGRLRDPGYAAFFARFISERDRVSFFSTLNGLLASNDVHSSLELDGRNFAIDQPLFAYLRRLRIEKMLDDARVMAVPTGDEDAESRRQRLQGYENLGLTLLNLAGLLVPGLGQVMLGVAVLQVANEVYEGYQDWQLGDRKAALAHLFGVAENVLLGAATGAGASAAGRLLERLPFVDGLSPIYTDGGQMKLCTEQITTYRVKDAGLTVGQQTQREGRQHLRLHEGTYQVQGSELNGTLRIRHPRRSDVGPLLEHNGAGGWRHVLEQPQEWTGAMQLLRRLGANLADITEGEAQSVLHSTGFDEPRLRRLHLENARAPARLQDAVECYRLHQQFPELRGEAFDELVASRQAMEQSTVAVLRRDFPGLSIRGAEEVVEQIDSHQLEQMLETGRVPLMLAERARWYIRDARLDRACAGLHQRQAVNTDTEKLALGLIEHLAPWPESIKVELRADSVAGALQAQAGTQEAEHVMCVVRGQQGYATYDASGRLLPMAAHTDSLAGALLLCLDAGQKLLLGDPLLSEQGLSRVLAKQAGSHREVASRLIGQAPVGGGVRPPVRFGDGRLGYPLSGRGASSRVAIRRAIRQVFPTLDDTQLNRYLVELDERGVALWEHVHQLHGQLARLRIVLRRWREERNGVLDLLRRQRVTDRLRRCWRRKTEMLEDGSYSLEIEGERVGSLPRLPDDVDFGHVTQLKLRNMNLSQLDADFLPRFPRLLSLDLRDNQLSTLPQGIEQLSALRRLRLNNNQIVMTSAANLRLRALTNLEQLDLGQNPLGTAPDVNGLVHLRELGLRATGLTQFPARVQQLPWRGLTDMRENQLRQLNQELHGLRLRAERVALHDNPLDEASEQFLSDVSTSSSVSGSGGNHSLPYRHQLVQEAERERWLVGAYGALRTQREARWRALNKVTRSTDFFRFLRDFAQSPDFQRHPIYHRMRMWQVIDACYENSEVREQLFLLAGGRGACEDRLLLIVSQMQVRVIIHQQTAGLSLAQSEVPLMQLGRSLFRLDQVDLIAAQRLREMRASGRHAIDDVEVYLTYRLRLAHTLGLPGQPSSMHYEAYSGVTAQDLNIARVAVLQAESNESLAAALAVRDFWQKHLRTSYPNRFTALFDSYQAPLADYLEQCEAGDINEETYLQHCKILLSQANAAERDLYLELTHQAYARWPIQ